ncbi:MAG: hypothetical protein QOG15_2791 [Solirubrobacteraceae bacterium]|nr:hypothetical protein [Solirubrobacteraceae bacterium]
MNVRVMIVPVTIAAGLSLGLTACGGSGDKKLAKADLAKKANAICKPAKTKRSAIAQPANLTADPVVAAAYFDKLIPITQKETDDLAKLKPKDDIKVDWTQFVARQKQATGQLIVVRDKAKAKDRSGIQDLAKLNRIGNKLTGEATTVGATECAQFVE